MNVASYKCNTKSRVAQITMVFSAVIIKYADTAHDHMELLQWLLFCNCCYCSLHYSTHVHSVHYHNKTSHANTYIAVILTERIHKLGANKCIY